MFALIALCFMIPFGFIPLTLFLGLRFVRVTEEGKPKLTDSDLYRLLYGD